MLVDSAEEQRRRELLAHFLKSNFGASDDDTLTVLRDSMDWLELSAGEVLMQQGQPGESVYLSLSGRLRVYVRDAAGQQRLVRELGRGEVTGEMSLFSGGPRSATVVAIRDTVLARLDKSHFLQLLTHAPQVSIAMTQKIIERLQSQDQQHGPPAPVMITLQPISEGVDARAFAQSLSQALGAFGRACWADAGTLAQRADNAGVHPDAWALALDALESQHDFVLLVADAVPSAWSRLCQHHSDEVLLLASAGQPARSHATETTPLDDTRQRSEAAETLVLLHPADTASPRGMAAWLARRPVAGHINMRQNFSADMQRLARLLSRNAVGLVLSGGGARGFAHLGIWQVLREQGIDIDYVGGTSIGAVMAALIASDQPADKTLSVARQAFGNNPTGDYNWLPLISLIKGQRVRHVVRKAIEQLLGGPTDMVDLWKGFFCIASNYSRGQEVCLQQGDLGRALLCSFAIPGALPPVVHAGDLLCDGGTFNNFPTNVMREMRGVGKVIGVDLGARQSRALAFDEVPGTWALLLDKLRARHRRRYKLPSLVSYLLNVSILYSTSRQAQSRRQADLYFEPPLHRVGLLQWDRFQDIVRQGRGHALEVLAQLPADQRQRWGLDENP